MADKHSKTQDYSVGDGIARHVLLVVLLRAARTVRNQTQETAFLAHVVGTEIAISCLRFRGHSVVPGQLLLGFRTRFLRRRSTSSSCTSCSSRSLEPRRLTRTTPSTTPDRQYRTARRARVADSGVQYPESS
eukprot:3938565-Rhodomonas_salina.2